MPGRLATVNPYNRSIYGRGRQSCYDDFVAFHAGNPLHDLLALHERMNRSAGRLARLDAGGGPLRDRDRFVLSIELPG